MLGISVYLSQFNEEYLKMAQSHGCEYIFTSLHIPEENLENIKEKVSRLLDTANKLGMSVVTDISPNTFTKLEMKENDFDSLKALGFKALRLDFGFDDPAVIKKLQKNFTVFLNASVIQEKDIENFEEVGVALKDVIMCHNFYPKTNTALSTDFFETLNKPFLKHHLQILTFVPGDVLKRFPTYEGLPTLESQRGKNSYVAGVELMKKYHVEDIVVGDSFAKEEHLAWLHLYMKEKILTLPAFLNDSSLYQDVISVRKDLSDKVIRLGTPRISNVPIETTLNRPQGTITMSNTLAERYSGEIQLVKKALPFSRENNIIGFVHPEYVELLDYLDGETKIQFIRI